MKKLLFAMTLFSMSVMGQSNAELDKKNGFQHFILGSKKSDNKKLIQISKLKGETTYTFSEKIKFGDYTLDPVYLVFFNDSLKQIEFTVMGMDGGAAALQAFKDAYGNIEFISVEDKKNLQRYIWKGNTVQLKYDHYDKSSNANVRFDYLPLMESQRIYKLKTAPKVTSGDL